MENIRPLDNDPDREQIRDAFDMNSDEWWLTNEGEYQSGAAEMMKFDGSNFQRVVILEWPARLNKSKETKVLRLAMSPEDALNLAKAMAYSALWLMENEQEAD